MYGWLRFVYSKGLEEVILMLIFIDDDDDDEDEDDEDEDGGEDSDSCSIIWIINLVFKKNFLSILLWDYIEVLMIYCMDMSF